MNTTGLRQVVGVGAGGHAKVMIETIGLAGLVEIIGLVDKRDEMWGTKVGGVTVLGGDDLLSELHARGITHAFIGVGSAHDMRPRRNLYQMVKNLGFEVVSAIDPRSMISSTALLGDALTVFAGALINAGAIIGDDVIVNSGVIVEHDCIIGDHVHIATGAKLASSVRVEDEVHVGVGACVRQGVKIGRGSIIGAGAVLIKDVPEEVVVVGVPGRILRHRENR